MNSTNLAGRAGRLAAAHWRAAVFGWLAFVAIAVVIGSAVGTKELTDADYATGEAARAERILADAGFETPATEIVLVQSPTLTASSPAFKAAVRDLVSRLSARNDVKDVRSPFAPRNRGQISKDGRSALVQFGIRGKPEDAPDKVQPILDTVAAVQKAHPQLFVGEFGYASAVHELNGTIGKDFRLAEITSIPVTLAILLVAFGSLVAAGLPVLLAFSGVLATLGLSALASHLVPSDDVTKSVILLIGMAVGVDYSLFYLRREREERAKGLSQLEALLKTARTSGQAVLISGLTVLIAMAGMLFTGSKIFTSIAVGAMLMVAVALIGSLSVLPALLSKLGDRVNKGRIPFIGRRMTRSPEPGLWAFVLDRVLRRPALAVGASAALLLALALPTVQLHTQLPSFTDLPNDFAIVNTYDRIQAAFPGAQVPAQVVVKANDVTSRLVH
jgi:RND superfamily putative drug exporter